jgi:hypothetical protein
LPFAFTLPPSLGLAIPVASDVGEDSLDSLLALSFIVADLSFLNRSLERMGAEIDVS